jgi:hypothetical protein
MLLSATRVERFAYADRLAREHGPDRIQETLELWSGFWRDVLLTTAQATTPLMNLDRADDVHSLARILSPGAAREVLAAVRRTRDLLDRNVNARLALEVLLLDWPRL